MRMGLEGVESTHVLTLNLQNDKCRQQRHFIASGKELFEITLKNR
jgi:hypothetical protein